MSTPIIYLNDPRNLFGDEGIFATAFQDNGDVYIIFPKPVCVVEVQFIFTAGICDLAELTNDNPNAVITSPSAAAWTGITVPDSTTPRLTFDNAAWTALHLHIAGGAVTINTRAKPNRSRQI